MNGHRCQSGSLSAASVAAIGACPPDPDPTPQIFFFCLVFLFAFAYIRVLLVFQAEQA